MLDDVVAKGCTAKNAAAWILTDCAGILRKNGQLLSDLAITADDLATIIKMVDDNTVNRPSGRKILTAVLEEGVDPVAYCKENGEINLGVVFAATEIDANAIYKSFEGLALTTNYNASLKDMKGEHLDRAFVMALYLEVNGAKQFVTASEGVTVLVDAANVEAITYNGVKEKEENKNVRM